MHLTARWVQEQRKLPYIGALNLFLKIFPTLLEEQQLLRKLLCTGANSQEFHRSTLIL